jgi:hypothetical protein
LVHYTSIKVGVTNGYICLAQLKKIWVIADPSAVSSYPCHFRLVRGATGMAKHDDRYENDCSGFMSVHATPQQLIGSPAHVLRLWRLDAQHNVVPVGQIGERCGPDEDLAPASGCKVSRG